MGIGTDNGIDMGVDALNDDQLFALYVQGDLLAFDLFYKKMSPKIWGFIKRRIVSVAIAEDVYQEVWSKIHRSREQYDAKHPVMPWVFTIARSVLYDSFRAVERNHENLVGDKVMSRAIDQSSMAQAQMNVSQDQSDQKRNDKIAKSLSALTADQKQLVDLRYRQELGFDEIAVSLGLSEANVRQKISRLFKVLRRRMT